MFSRNSVLTSFLLLPVSIFGWQATVSHGPDPDPQHSPTRAKAPIPDVVKLELDRAIVVLNRGLKEGWAIRDQYLAAFEKTPNINSSGRSVKDAKSSVECAIGEYLRTHQIWDEGPPLQVEVQRAIVNLTEIREEEAFGLQSAACLPVPRRVILSAGVASGLLKSKVNPIYPREAVKNHMSGTVVLHGQISPTGNVRVLRVISGASSLRQAALNAVRQWTYQPYLLNDKPIEFETTINVLIAPSR